MTSIKYRYVLPVLTAVCFALVATMVLRGSTAAFDARILLFIYSYASPPLDAFFLFVSIFAMPLFVALFAVLTTVYYLYRRNDHRAVIVAITLGGIAALNVALKLCFQRPRPELWQRLVFEPGLSFPSWHAMSSFTIACLIIYLAHGTKHHRFITTLAIGYFLLVSFSRLYLGVHYPSDILGGWLAGASWFGLVLIFDRWRAQKARGR